MRSPILLDTGFAPVIAALDILVEEPMEQSSKMVLGLVAAIAGVVLIYFLVRRKRQ